SNVLSISSEMARFAPFPPPAPSRPYEIYRSYIHPDDRERVDRSRLDCASGLRPRHNERFRVVHPETGKVVWGETWGRMFEGPNGKRRMVGTLLDIQASMEAEQQQLEALEQMRVSEERYRMLLESGAETVLVVDAATGRLIDANKNAERFLKRTRH